MNVDSQDRDVTALLDEIVMHHLLRPEHGPGRAIPCSCSVDEFGSHTVPRNHPGSTYVKEMLTKWYRAPVLQRRYQGKLFPVERIALAQDLAVRLPNIPTGCEDSAALAYVMGNGMIKFTNGDESEGLTLLIHIPDEDFTYRSHQFHAPPILTHFMRNPDEKPFTRMTEFLQSLGRRLEDMEAALQPLNPVLPFNIPPTRTRRSHQQQRQQGTAGLTQDRRDRRPHPSQPYDRVQGFEYNTQELRLADMADALTAIINSMEEDDRKNASTQTATTTTKDGDGEDDMPPLMTREEIEMKEMMQKKGSSENTERGSSVPTTDTRTSEHEARDPKIGEVRTQTREESRGSDKKESEAPPAKQDRATDAHEDKRPETQETGTPNTVRRSPKH